MRIWHISTLPESLDDPELGEAVRRLATAQEAPGDDVRIVEARELRSSGLRERPEVLHLHGLFGSSLLRLAPLLRRTPYVLSLHGGADPANLARRARRTAPWTSVADQRLARGAEAVIARTTRERRDAYRAFAESPVVRIVPDPADPLLLAADRWTMPDAGPILTSVGGVSAAQGLDQLDEIARRLPQETFEPALRAPDRTQAMRRAKAFLLLSQGDGEGSAITEAMALGIPCLVSSAVAASLGNAAPIIRLPEEPRLAADLAARALLDPAWLDATGRAGRRWVRERCAPHVVAARTATIYDEAVERPSLRRRHLRQTVTATG
jgi:glycosyltransferase involved in cell wall biosynthesis